MKQPLKILITEEEIRAKVIELGDRITNDYQGKELILICILKGSFIFMSDLCRKINLPLYCEFMSVSSYGDDTKHTGVVQINTDLKHPISGKDVVIVEDIVDTGLTMKYLTNNIATRMPRSLKICSLLLKPSKNVEKVKVDYLGFEIEDNFVLGYGLDVAGQYRNMPYIGYFEND